MTQMALEMLVFDHTPPDCFGGRYINNLIAKWQIHLTLEFNIYEHFYTFARDKIVWMLAY